MKVLILRAYLVEHLLFIVMIAFVDWKQINNGSIHVENTAVLWMPLYCLKDLLDICTTLLILLLCADWWFPSAELNFEDSLAQHEIWQSFVSLSLLQGPVELFCVEELVFDISFVQIYDWSYAWEVVLVTFLFRVCQYTFVFSRCRAQHWVHHYSVCYL